MIYQLPNGKSIELSIEQYLRMTDEDLKGLVAYNFGEEFNDPFIHSVLKNGSIDADDFEELNENDFTEEELQDLVSIDPEEKLYDDDYIDYDNLEQ
jgi:hypothetical protein